MEGSESDPRKDGRRALFCWGANSYGQLGLGRRSEQEQQPVEASLPAGADLEGCPLVLGGGGHSVLVSGNRRAMWSCGWNSRGQLGTGDRVDSPEFVPVPLPFSSDPSFAVAAVSCGWDFSAFVTGCGRAFACGSNAFGQIGLGEECKGVDGFIPVPGLSEGATTVACGLRHTVFLSSGGRAFGCGSNRRGQLGDGGRNNWATVRPLSGLPASGLAAVSAGQHFTLILAGDGGVFSFGDDKFGQLIGGKSDEEAAATANSAVRKLEAAAVASPIREISCGWTHVTARLGGGDVLCWGRGDYGQLGRPDSGRIGSRGEAGAVPLLKASAVSSGSEHVLALRIPDGQLVSWGWNEHGSCGDGSASNVLDPTRVRLPAAVAAVESFCAASGHNLAIVMLNRC